MMGALYNKYGKNKIYLFIAILLIIINIAILKIYYQTQIQFSIDGQSFKYVSHDEEKMLLKDKEGNMVTLTIDTSDGGFAPLCIASKYEIEYKNKIIKCDNSDWMNKGRIIILSDGSKYTKKVITIVAGNSNKPKKNIPFDVQLVNNIEDIHDFVDDNPLKVAPIFSIPLIFLGLSCVMYPENMWRFQHMLSVSGGEPTDFAIISNIICGIMVIGFALFMPFI